MSRRRPIAALALLLAAGGAAAVLAGTSSPPAAGKKGGGGEATVVQRRDLVQTDTESGTLSYAGSRTVYDRLAGTITWLPSAGRVIRPGGTLFAVDGRPVILLDGSTPAYRDLAPGDSDGPDVLQLNRNLVALGYDPAGIVLDQEWQAATTAGVEALQTSLGESPTGSLSLGQVVFLPGDQIVSGVEATLGSGGGGSSGAGNPVGAGNPSGSGSPAATGASDPRAAAPVAVVASAGERRPAEAAMQDVALATTGGAGTPTPNPSSPPAAPKPSAIRRLEALVAHLQAELAKLAAQGKSPGASSPQSPGGNQPPGSGSPSGTPEGGASPTPILQTTSTRLVVTVNLEAGKQREARVGARVSVELPGGVTVNGRVADVGRVAQHLTPANGGESGGGEPNGGAGSGGSSSTVPVTIALAGHGAGANLDQAVVSVSFTQAVARHVLCVPVTALLATPGARYAVQEVAQPQSLIPVSTGMFAAGYVQISGAGLHPGLRVTNSQG